ncbi:hypothetical protein Bca101_032004 [Brassica carinata]
MPGLIWDGTSSIGSGEAELKYFNGVLSFFLCPFDFILMLQMFLSVVDSESGVRLLDFLEEDSVVDGLVEFVWSNGFGGRYHFLCFQSSLLVLWSLYCSLLLVKFRGGEVVQFLGLKPTGSSGLLVLGGLLRTQIIRLASLSHSSLLPAPFSFSILEVHRVSPMVLINFVFFLSSSLWLNVCSNFSLRMMHITLPVYGSRKIVNFCWLCTMLCSKLILIY